MGRNRFVSGFESIYVYVKVSITPREGASSLYSEASTRAVLSPQFARIPYNRVVGLVAGNKGLPYNLDCNE